MSTKVYYDIDKDGMIVGQFDTEPPNNPDMTIIHTTPPPDAMLKPRWVGDATTGQWVDAATRTEHEAHIDRHTDFAIQRWCREQGKNEPYYINCGIKVAIDTSTDTTNINYQHYKAYRAFVEAQKKSGKAKKQALP